MSSAKCTTFVLQLSVPHHVCQLELAHILELRRQREAIDVRIQEAENSLRGALEVGAVVQAGIYQAYLSVQKPGQAPSLIISE